MTNTLIQANSTFPNIEVIDQAGNHVSLLSDDELKTENQYSLVLVYRGAHCPKCLDYLNSVDEHRQRLKKLNVDLKAVSADSQDQVQQMIKKGLNVNYPILCSLQLEDMKKLGLYLSEPLNDNETDHIFPEPALFLINPDKSLRMIEVANSPFIRPDVELLIDGIEFSLTKDYPARGTYQYEQGRWFSKTEQP
jgi:peroxiredoxin